MQLQDNKLSIDLKKNILIAEELASSEVGEFFQNLGFELFHSYVEGQEYTFVIDNACPELRNVPRLQVNQSLIAELEPMVCGRINKEMFESEQGRALLSSYFNDARDFDLVDRYSKEMANIYSIKIHEYLNVGYFVDSIIIEAYKANFDISALRTYLNTAFKFSFTKVESSSNTMPIDVSYSHNGEAFAVQISLMCDEWRGIPEMDSCINDLLEATNYFDTTYFSRTNRLTLSALFFKNAEIKKAKANFFTEIAKRTSEVELRNPTKSELYSGLVFNEPVRYQPPKLVIEDPASKLLIARKFAHYIKDYRQRIEVPPIPLGKLVVDDVLGYLAHYPRQEELQEIDSEIKHFVFKLLMNDLFSNEVDNFVQIISDSFPHGVVREIHKIMGDKGLDDLETIIAGQPLKVEDGFITRVKGSSDVSRNSHLKRIVGPDASALSDNDLREIRKAQLNIKEDATTSFTMTDPEENLKREKLEEEFSKSFSAQEVSPDVVIEKLESQLNRFKKVMNQLKKEILKLQAEKIDREESDRNKEKLDEQNVLRIKSTMERSLETIKNKDSLIEKMKKDFDQFIKMKDQSIENLELKILSMKNEGIEEIEDITSEKVNKLENENKTLNFKLDLANKKINIVTERLGKRLEDTNAKRLREIESLKDNLKLAQSIIDEMRIEKVKLENRAIDDREKIKRTIQEPESKNNEEEKDSIIHAMATEKKALEEKFRSQSIELKKAEQKLKYTLAQLDSASKKKPSSNTSLKSPEAYAKQLELASSRMTEVTAEVIDKRREIVKVKQENVMMSAKIAELEKKLLNLDKKVA